MYAGIMDDGRKVVVDDSQGTRLVSGTEFFLLNSHVTVLLDGGWQVVRKKRLKPATYGSPFAALRR